MPKKNIYQTNSPAQTKKIAGILAEESLKKKSLRNALIFAFRGDLGTGKTTFIQGFLKKLGIKEKITSPTFIIMRTHKLSNKLIYHIDCYRIKKLKDINVLGLEEIFKNPRNIVLIEWANKIKKILPRNSVWIKLEHGRNIRERIIKIK